MIETSVALSEALVYLERLLDLDRRKNSILKENKQAELPAIVAAEVDVLGELDQLRQKRNSPSNQEGHDSFAHSASSPQMLAQVASTVAELQQVNGSNSLLIQEHLAGVSMCIELLSSAASPTYSPTGTSSEDRVIRRMLDVKG
jgi:flagellar biosynthesis/type III secretory pathway chaperone